MSADREGAAVETLRDALGEHTPVYDYRNGHFTMECEACDFKIGGVDRDNAKRRFGEHFAALVIAAGWVPQSEVAERERAAAEKALREAADDLEGRLGTEGAPKSLWEFRAWLRARADRLGSAS